MLVLCQNLAWLFVVWFGENINWSNQQTTNILLRLASCSFVRCVVWRYLFLTMDGGSVPVATNLWTILGKYLCRILTNLWVRWNNSAVSLNFHTFHQKYFQKIINMYWVETSWLFLIRLEGLIKGFQLKKIPSSALIFEDEFN